jgi:hypothetical protein
MELGAGLDNPIIRLLWQKYDKPLRIELAGGLYHVTSRGEEHKSWMRDCKTPGSVITLYTNIGVDR